MPVSRDGWRMEVGSQCILTEQRTSCWVADRMGFMLYVGESLPHLR